VWDTCSTRSINSRITSALNKSVEELILRVDHPALSLISRVNGLAVYPPRTPAERAVSSSDLLYFLHLAWPRPTSNLLTLHSFKYCSLLPYITLDRNSQLLTENMTSVSPKELLTQLKALKSNMPSELSSDQDLRFQLCSAAREAYLSLEQPTDVVARILLSQVCWSCSLLLFSGSERGAASRRHRYPHRHGSESVYYSRGEKRSDEPRSVSTGYQGWAGSSQ